MSLRRREDRTDWRTIGDDPDERFSFANERTFLAWNRTALALVTAGLAITQLLPELAITGPPDDRLTPDRVGTVIAFLSYREWVANEKALRLKAKLPPSPLPLLLSSVITITAVVALIFAAAGQSK